MALRPCKACGSQISSKAKACPTCGHPQPKPTSILTKLFFGLIGLVVLVGFVGGAILRSSAPPPGRSLLDTPGLAPIVPGTSNAKPAPTAEEAKAKAEGLRAAIGAKALANASKDPESFELKSATVHPDGTVCYNYRAKNSFNAMLVGSAMLLPKGNILIEEHDGNRFVSAWNKACTKADGNDMADYARLMMGGP